MSRIFSSTEQNLDNSSSYVPKLEQPTCEIDRGWSTSHRLFGLSELPSVTRHDVILLILSVNRWVALCQHLGP